MKASHCIENSHWALLLLDEKAEETHALPGEEEVPWEPPEMSYFEDPNPTEMYGNDNMTRSDEWPVPSFRTNATPSPDAIESSDESSSSSSSDGSSSSSSDMQDPPDYHQNAPETAPLSPQTTSVVRGTGADLSIDSPSSSSASSVWEAPVLPTSPPNTATFQSTRVLLQPKPINDDIQWGLPCDVPILAGRDLVQEEIVSFHSPSDIEVESSSSSNETDVTPKENISADKAAGDDLFSSPDSWVAPDIKTVANIQDNMLSAVDAAPISHPNNSDLNPVICLSMMLNNFIKQEGILRH